ncbi:putative bifunctional diguanylate cyclase/phosphodiesterase [Actinoplanes sp. NPDC051859]|uniref:putative bifunctional diguanylate cyclase/phosphodiesterase n=1 Tax=Actinoplanes sp. NPDC051859 TaxID=3363909 RepID=UPI00379BF0D2
MVRPLRGALRTRVTGFVRRGAVTIAALAAVLLALAAYVLHGTLHTTRATEEQQQALVVAALFTEARIAIAMEEVNLRHYQVEPSVAIKQRFDKVAANADRALTDVIATGVAQAGVDAKRLREQQAAYRDLAEHLMVLVADSDPRQAQLDRLEVTPAFYSLQDDVDDVARAYHDSAQQQVSALRRTQGQLLAGTAVGFAAGLALVGMIMRLVLGYQRRLLAQADESRHQALHDPLTGLPNRNLFGLRLDEALRAAATDNGHQVALMVVDLDGFKAVNDTLGHHAGDQVLLEAGRRLSAAAGDEGIVARLGGDEFAVLLPRVPDLGTATVLAERMVADLRRNFVLDEGPAAISGSLGIALGRAELSGADLFRNADGAMYRAKAGGGGVTVFDALADTCTQDRMQLLAELRGLLDDGDPQGRLRLHYQPQVRLSDGTVTSVEALVRWEHPERGLLPPAEFLTIAESSGLEVRLTCHLLALAVRQAATWAQAGTPYCVAVNVSPGCLIDRDFVPTVLAAVSAAGLSPQLLRLELTETSIMADPASTVRALCAIRDHGISVSVDDFGTGFSSLAQLRHVPADELKIDRMFIKDLGKDPAERTPDAVMVRSAVDLGHNLGLSVVAEGVEDISALLHLRDMTCDYAQGYALSRPVPADDLPEACARAEHTARTAIAAVESTDREGPRIGRHRALVG